TDEEEQIEPVLKELRDRVLYVHKLLETSLGWLLWKWIAELGKYSVPKEIYVQMGSRFDLFIREVDFVRKVKLAQELTLIPSEVTHLLIEVNSLRLIFSHPKSHKTEVRALLDRKKYLHAQKILTAAYDGIKKPLKEAYKGMAEVLQPLL